FHTKGAYLFNHRRRIAFTRFYGFRFLASGNTSDKAIHVPDKVPNFFSGREDFYFFFESQLMASWYFLLSELRPARKRSMSFGANHNRLDFLQTPAWECYRGRSAIATLSALW